MSKSSVSSIAIVWLRNDLRLHDHEGFLLAQKYGGHLLPLYCFDPRHFQGTWHFGFPKTGSHRTKFLIQSIKDLKRSLQERGSNLLIKCGKPEEIIPDLIKSMNYSKSYLIYQEEVTKEELDVEKNIKENCKSLRINITTYWGSTLYHKSDTPFPVKKIPDTYTEFRKAVENECKPRNVLQMPEKFNPYPVKVESDSLPTLSHLGVNDLGTNESTAFPFEGGETNGIARLKSYFWETNHIASYKETRNGLIGKNYSTKFSPWLSFGCLSPRYIHYEVRQYENDRQANQSTYWVLFELIWRDYFRFVSIKYGDRIFYPSGIKGKRTPWKRDDKLFDMWKDGRTGVPFVDANMRELKKTGWMSNRGRQNVASFLVKDLLLDWRLGAEWFESLLLDHDVCSNYGNWNYSAGIGNDPRENRKFNIVKQGLDYDYEGNFVRLWVPELCGIKDSMVHIPWKLSLQKLQQANVSLGETYPNPILIAPEWGRHDHKAGSSYGKQKSNWSQQRQTKQRGMDFYFKSNK